MDKPLSDDPEMQHTDNTALMEKQLRGLVTLYKVTQAQNEPLKEMLTQQEAQTSWLVSIGERAESGQSVKVENINMPFSALVGFLLKVAFASIPAALIFYIVAGIAIGTFLSLFFGIGASALP